MRRFFGYIFLLTPTVLWIAAVWRYEGMYEFIQIALAAVLHECGHLLAFSALGLPMPRISPVARGVRLLSQTELSYRGEAIVAAAGPMINLLVFCLGLPWQGRVTALYDFGEMNLVTALCNLVPMADLDGERILRCLLAPHLSDRGSYLVMRGVNAAALFLGLFLSLILYWYTGGGLYPGMLCLSALLSANGNTAKQEEKRGNQRKTQI